LARRCWPGPVTLVYGNGVADGLAARLPASVGQWICPKGTLGLRSPAHQAIQQVLYHLPGPLALTSANRSGEPEATTMEGVVEAVGEHLALVIDDGPSRYGKPSTVVQVNGTSWNILREGVVSANLLQRLSCCMIVFVCTGNTCRSPMAEALCKKLLAERLGCTPDDLTQRGFVVLSGGLSAMMGGGAAAEAIGVAQEMGADLSQHASQALSRDIVAQADFLMAMTHGHLRALTAQYPQLGSRARLLSADGSDIADPIGSN